MAITTKTFDRQVYAFTAVASAGTAVVNVAIPTDAVVRLEARIFVVQSSSGHNSAGASMLAAYAIRNNNGTLAVPAAITGSANPDNSGGLLAASAEASDIGGTPTANWTNSGTNAVLTVTNSSGSAADVFVIVDVFVVSNV